MDGDAEAESRETAKPRPLPWLMLMVSLAMENRRHTYMPIRTFYIRLFGEDPL